VDAKPPRTLESAYMICSRAPGLGSNDSRPHRRSEDCCQNLAEEKSTVSASRNGQGADNDDAATSGEGHGHAHHTTSASLVLACSGDGDVGPHRRGAIGERLVDDPAVACSQAMFLKCRIVVQTQAKRQLCIYCGLTWVAGRNCSGCHIVIP